MTSAERSKQNYEKRPYPGAKIDEILTKGRSFPSVKWMQGIGRPGQRLPERVLVAGCGTGAEAFVMRRRLPQAEIMGIDFSPRSIAVAQRLQRALKTSPAIDFQVADLTDRNFSAQLGGPFDLITCHGVLSYLPEPQPVLLSFAECLREDGALYLGVNGDAHPATRLRPWLRGCGYNVDELGHERRLRRLLRIWDALHDDGIGGLAGMSSSYLASDICGMHFNNWPLARWRAEAEQSGWAIVGQSLLPLALRLLLAEECYRELLPASVGELAERIDQMRPASFHQMILRRTRSAALGRTVPSRAAENYLWTGLYSLRVAGPKSKRGTRVILGSSIFRLEFDWFLNTRQLRALQLLVATKAPPPNWPTLWGTRSRDREILSVWIGFGVLAPGTVN